MKPRVFTGTEGDIRIERTSTGVVRIEARGEDDLAFGMGYAHGHDRQVQMLFTRIIGQGRLAECLADNDETVGIDRFMRRLGFNHYAIKERAELTAEDAIWVESYVRGVNIALADARRPLEFVLTGYHPEPWTLEDSLLIGKLVAYIGLAQTQQRSELLIIDSIRRGVDIAHLKRLFSPHLEGLTPEIIALVKELHFDNGELPAEAWPPALPRLLSSNNWVLAGSRTRSGKPLLALDPHLEVNRLPAVWYEYIGVLPQDYRMGINLPGLPGVIMGRNSKVSFGFTYGFMDLVDYFIEDLKEGHYLRDGKRVPVAMRRETIKRKKHAPVVVDVPETDLGFLETDPGKDGLHLCHTWASYHRGALRSIRAIKELQVSQSVEEAQRAARQIQVSSNWLIADTAGNIGYQQAGNLPRRAHSGLYPLPAWEAGNRWNGEIPSRELVSILNPPEGFIATANDNWQLPGQPPTINLHMGDHRVGRIKELLQDRKGYDTAQAKAMQSDLVSLQAQRYMAVLGPLLPDNEAGRRLAAWDCAYRLGSVEPLWFEALLSQIHARVFAPMFGPKAWEFITNHSGLFQIMMPRCDEIILSGDDVLPAAKREALFREVAQDVLASPLDGTWGAGRDFLMKNVFFDGKLPGFLGFDYGPITAPGGRVTLPQANITESLGRQIVVMASWRCIADMGTNGLETILAGGPSGKRFSRWYTSEVERWLQFSYKSLAV